MNSTSVYSQATAPLEEALEERDATDYDVAIIGGGLAGLSLSILLAKMGHSVVLYEKEHYPFHRVCGEYISLECWNFLENLGYPLSDMDLPMIRNLVISAPDGSFLKQRLPLGGFGISRFKIDKELADLARNNGVKVLEGCKVTDVLFRETFFHIQCPGFPSRVKLACGTFGKRSNLDIKWKRSFTEQKPSKLNNYIGVKYHIETDFPPDSIALHNFRNGYCGLSRVEEGKYCLCYLTTAENLKASHNSIINLERNILQRNPFLKQIFNDARVLYQTPLTISQVSFERKSQVEGHVLMVGDAGGMITPLCGNGMSMALHGSKIAAELIGQFLAGRMSRLQFEGEYVEQWSRLFQKRLQAGRVIQQLFGREWVTNLFIRTVKPFPRFVSYIIRQTHGEPF